MTWRERSRRGWMPTLHMFRRLWCFPSQGFPHTSPQTVRSTSPPWIRTTSSATFPPSRLRTLRRTHRLQIFL
ncbi:hypothetical protein L210DRAFT_3563904 [Boletus edulis BED1]|uniref:Uncharacterized protein n=1 Tax=Boletus edulis BED1 TaxID=1328754 RepID=A0AAD4G8N0_BOLED|nr:hypothetical protein L210DRAFT_3563904 [Boletus edulis BED1]